MLRIGSGCLLEERQGHLRVGNVGRSSLDWPTRNGVVWSGPDRDLYRGSGGLLSGRGGIGSGGRRFLGGWESRGLGGGSGRFGSG